MEDSINITINLTPKMIDKLTEEILKNGGKKLLKAISDRAVSEKKQEITEIIYNVEEVSKITSQHKTTILRHIENGILKATKPGKSHIITQTNLNNYINGDSTK